jgi:hypothetical protein
LAKKLNIQFKSDKFTVVLLKVGSQVYPWCGQQAQTDRAIGGLVTRLT